MKLPVDNLAAHVESWKHASRRSEFYDMASIFSGATPELGCPRSTPNPGNLNRLPGCFLRSYNCPQKRRLPQKSGNPRHGACPQTGPSRVSYPMRDRRVSEHARVSPSLRGQTRKHPAVAPTSEITIPALGAAGTLTTLPRWQARCWPAISRGQSNGWVNYAHERKRTKRIVRIG